MAEYTHRPFVESSEAIRQSDCALELKAAGADIQGGIYNGGMGTDNLIKITQWENRVYTAVESGTGRATGRRAYNGLHLIGPISKAAPLILKALTLNQVIEAKLKCLRLKESGDRENHFNIKVKKGRIADYEVLTSPLDGSLYYEFTITFAEIEYEWPDGGVVHQDSWQMNQ
jgi:type VI secretion system secreted protein Hcp